MIVKLCDFFLDKYLGLLLAMTMFFTEDQTQRTILLVGAFICFEIVNLRTKK